MRIRFVCAVAVIGVVGTPGDRALSAVLPLPVARPVLNDGKLPLSSALYPKGAE